MNARTTLCMGVLLLAGCAKTVPDPRIAAEAYARAVQSSDANALWELLTDEARRELPRDKVPELLRREHVELTEKARGVEKPIRVEAAVQLTGQNGEQLLLVLERGEYRVGAAGSLPLGARTPTEALDQLRCALSMRSYGALARVLSPRTRRGMESELRGLVEGLRRPDTLVLQRVGDRATVRLTNGHTITLLREGGVWRVDDVQ